MAFALTKRQRVVQVLGVIVAVAAGWWVSSLGFVGIVPLFLAAVILPAVLCLLGGSLLRVTVVVNVILFLVALGRGAHFKISTGYYAAYGDAAVRQELPIQLAGLAFCVLAAAVVTLVWRRVSTKPTRAL